MPILNLNDRVEKHTAPPINEKIETDIKKSMLFYAHNPQLIDNRIEQIKHEWDIEQVLETNASIIALTGVLFSIIGKKTWLILPTIVLSFLLQHAIQGWCPPISIFRRLGFRTKVEISNELISLLALRGDFNDLSALQEKTPKERADGILHSLAA